MKTFYLDGFVAHLHPAAGDAAVLLCPPFGWDDVCSYRSRRDWAERLAAGGRTVLRYDLPGEGDSPGSPLDPGRVDAWIAATVAAARFLRPAHVTAVGIGLGGLLAQLAGAEIDDLVLWAVPESGRALVRELRAFARFETAAIVAGGAPEPPPGMLAPGGFVLSPETVEALSALEAPPPSGRVLRLERDAEYAAMMARPDEAKPPANAFARIEAWLREPAPAAAPIASGPAALEGERPVTLGGLRGILTEPAGDRADVTAVLLNAAAVRRIGPNRMWVDIARRWAAKGVPTLRIDLAGIGDSDGDASRYSDVAELYVPEFVDQVRGVLDELDGRRFVLLGLCSGAFWAFHTALQDERVSAAILLNSRVLFWDDALEAGRDLRRMRAHLFRPQQWRRVLTGELEVTPGRVLTALRARRVDAAAEIEAAFDRLRDSGTRVVLAFTDGEPLRDELERDGYLARLDDWPNLTLELLPGRDHTLRPLWMHEPAHAAVDRALDRELDRAAART